MRMRKILFIQFSNSAAYPPVENAVRLCVAHGHDVSILCVESEGAASLRFSDALEVIAQRLPRYAGRIGYLYLFLKFNCLVLWKVLFNRIDWVYASDPLTSPAAYLVKKFSRCRVIYHEHDAPAAASSRFQRLVNHTRLRMANIADGVVIPNADRLALYLDEANCQDRENTFCVWNCPLPTDAIDGRNEIKNEMTLYFHGSIGPARLPFTLLEALLELPQCISLTIAGYPTDGGTHIKNIISFAQSSGIGERVSYIGPVKERAELLHTCGQYDLGICFYDLNPAEVNHKFMAGASNKPFDYLSQGLMLLMSDIPEQRSLFDGFDIARFCDAHSATSIRDVINEIFLDSSLRAAAGSIGPKLIKDQWNYAKQFRPVLEFIENRVT